MSKKVTKGNVFEHLGFTKEEADKFARQVDLEIATEKAKAREADVRESLEHCE